MKIKAFTKKFIFISWVIVVICIIYILNFYRISTNKNDELKKNSNYHSISKSLFLVKSAFSSELENKLVLRLKNDYCEACINPMLYELYKCSTINRSNFMIVTQFDNERMLKCFTQYTNYATFNYKESILPFDTLIQSHSYFFFINEELSKVIAYEYVKGDPYMKIINEYLSNNP